MTRMQFHILNGDALKEQFPTKLSGECIVARECLVDGEVGADSLKELYDIRAEFLMKNYALPSKEDYYKKGVAEFEKIQNIPDNSEVFFWFEDDLFCQVNFWFVAQLVQNSNSKISSFLVRPKVHNQYGFGGYSEEGLLNLFENRIILPDLTKFAILWDAYAKNDEDTMQQIAKELAIEFPFVAPAVQAHLDRKMNTSEEGRPSKTLRTLISELGVDNFSEIFREFSKRESIYGYGDLQVKNLMSNLSDESE